MAHRETAGSDGKDSVRIQELSAVVCDETGTLFFAGVVDVSGSSQSVSDWKPRVWCRRSGGELVWMLDADLELGSRIGLAMGPGGGPLLAWSNGDSGGGHAHAVRIDPATGRVLGTLGSEGGHLDLREAGALDVDVDGSLIVLMGDRLRRFSREGRLVRMWPRPPLVWDVATFGMLGRTRRRRLGPSVLDEYPQFLPNPYGSRLRVGWDGHLYVVAPCNNLVLVHRIDRGGRIVYSIELPDSFGPEWLPRADRQSRLVMAHSSTVARLSADGSEVETLEERSSSDPDIAGLAVGPEGEITLALDGEHGDVIPVAGDRGEGGRATRPLPDRRRVVVPVLAGLLALGLARVAALLFLLAPALERTRQGGGVLEGYPTIAGSVPRVGAEVAARWLDLLGWVFTLEGVSAVFLVLALGASIRYPRQAILQALPAILITQPIVLVLVPWVGGEIFSLYNFQLVTECLAFAPPFVWAAGVALASRAPIRSS